MATCPKCGMSDDPDDFDIPDEEYHYTVPDYDGDHLWKTKDGRQLFVSEMTDQHVQNTLNYLRKRKSDLTLYVSNNHVIDLFQLDYTEAWIPIFEQELKKRNIKEGGWNVREGSSTKVGQHDSNPQSNGGNPIRRQQGVQHKTSRRSSWIR